MKNNRLRSLTRASMIAALYVALTALSASLGLAIGPFELRFSEALCILPVFTPAAVPGLFVGCLTSNLMLLTQGGNLWDVIFGSLATLLGAWGTYCWREKRLLPYLSPIFWNTLMLPPVLYFAYGFQEDAFPLLVLTFLCGEGINAGLLAFLLKKSLLPFRKHLQ